MKKVLSIVALIAMIALPVFAEGSTESKSSAGFVPTKDVEWTCTSKPGGGSDIFTQQIKATDGDDELSPIYPFTLIHLKFLPKNFNT